MGKTRLVIRYIKNTLHRKESEVPTIAVSFFTCNIILDEVKIKLQVRIQQPEYVSVRPTLLGRTQMELPRKKAEAKGKAKGICHCPTRPLILFAGWAAGTLIWVYSATGCAAGTSRPPSPSPTVLVTLFVFFCLQFVRPLHFVLFAFLLARSFFFIVY